MPAKKPRHSFDVIFAGARPSGEPATKAKLIITKPDGQTIPLILGPAELRRLIRTALSGLGYTKIARPSGQWEKTWSENIDKKLDVIHALIKSVFPLDNKSVTK